MFVEVGLHLENRITVCPTVRRPNGEQRGGGEEGEVEDYETTMHLYTTRAGGFSGVRPLRFRPLGSLGVAVTIRRRDCEIGGTPESLSYYAAPLNSCSPAKSFGSMIFTNQLRNDFATTHVRISRWKIRTAKRRFEATLY